jgi:hypothetical protein
LLVLLLVRSPRVLRPLLLPIALWLVLLSSWLLGPSLPVVFLLLRGW